MRDATFTRDGRQLLAPVTLTVEYAERAGLACESALAAGIAARLSAGIVKCSGGSVFVGDFDPKIQPVQVKRLVGFLPHARPPVGLKAERYFAYRAALWGLDRLAAVAHGNALAEKLHGLERDEAVMLAAIYLHDPQLIVLERPTDGLREAAESLLETRALFATYAPADRAA